MTDNVSIMTFCSSSLPLSKQVGTSWMDIPVHCRMFGGVSPNWYTTVRLDIQLSPLVIDF
jgi:hypothetical protein